MTIALPSLPTRFALHPVRLWAHAFNLLTQQQPWAAQRLAAHAGQTLRICLGGFQVTFTIGHDGTLEAADSAVVPDVVLELIAEKLSLTALLSPEARTDIAQLVHVTGPAALVQVVSDLARDLRPDPEDALAQWLGAVPAAWSKILPSIFLKKPISWQLRLPSRLCPKSVRSPWLT